MVIEEELWMPVADIAREIIRGMLDVMDGHTLVLTRADEPFAYMPSAATWDELAAGSVHPSAGVRGGLSVPGEAAETGREE